ncbi:PUB domain containing protein [Trichuris trichiura]|uniref:PUB domain containing protein n=1 Tax=Trichuris trichiura TaxID=36087 RepID=A0A077Z6G1_TRITR|nr:PUB domain containing protein [Trichuris trichiura]
MDRIRDLINKKKLNAKFKRAGRGRTLNAPQINRRRMQSDVFEALGRRCEIQGSLTRSRARRQLEVLNVDAASEEEPPESDMPKAGTMASKFGIYFTCDLLGDEVFMPKKELVQAIESHLRSCLEDEPLLISSLMVKSLNSFDRCDSGVKILCRYLDNLINNPSEEKYHSIRMGNKTFQEKVALLKGGVEFLLAAGFENEEFLTVLPEQFDMEHFTLARDCLVSTERIPIRVYRNPKITKLNEAGLLPTEEDLPAEFFQRTAQEISHEQRSMAENVEKLTTLRTREMRERDDAKLRKRYLYAVVRVRFPDDWILEVNMFVFTEASPFDVEQFTMSLAELQLSPSCTLLFQPDECVIQNALAAGRSFPSSFIKAKFITPKN